MNASPLRPALRGALGSGAIVPDCADRVPDAIAAGVFVERLVGNRSRPRLVPIVLSAAMVIAPFAAWLFAPEAGLAVMAAGLCALAYLLRLALAETDAAIHFWLRLAMAADLLLAAACLGLLVWLIAHR